jgi:indolepyruvate ferredoxin oxidoreductase
VHGARVRKAGPDPAGITDADTGVFAELPSPTLPSCAEPYAILITGIGGTGVVTIGALLGMAAHIEGKGVSVLDQTGLSQKNGAVASHVRIADDPDALHAVRIATGGTRLLLGCDIVTATTPGALATLNQGVSHAVINSHVATPAAFLFDPSIDLSAQPMIQRIRSAAGGEHATFIDATRTATALLGDAIASNMFLLGFAFQKGLIPLSQQAIFRAIELNNVAVETNQQAFQWGRLAAYDPAAIEQRTQPMTGSAEPEVVARDIREIVARRVAFLTDYQNAAYAGRYRDRVENLIAVEKQKTPGRSGLSEAVARHFFKLMAYKDEYEVARLYTSGEFRHKLQQQFEGDYTLKFHLAPPLLARRDPLTGELQKREYGAWMFKAFGLLAGLRRLRGTPLDIFGRTAERRMERQLIVDYESLIDEIAGRLDQNNYDIAVQLASLPDRIRGYGHIKERSIKEVKAEQQQLLEIFRADAESMKTASAA